MTLRPWLAALAAGALLLTGCNGSAKPAATSSPSASARPSDAPTPPYGATLVAAEKGTATLTNTGRKADRYIVQVVPGNVGAVAEPTVDLKPGKHVIVRYALSDPEQAKDVKAQLVAHSTTTGEDTVLPLS